MPDSPEEKKDLPPGVQQFDVPVERVLVSMQRQMGVLHQEIALKDAALELAHDEIASLKGAIDELAKRIPPGRTTPKRRK